MRAWLRGGIVGIVAVLALFFAAHAHEGFGRYFAMLVFVLAVLLLFRLIARAFDPPGAKSPIVPVPRSQPARLWLTGLLAIGGVICLFVAAHGGNGGSYYVGLMLAAVLWLYAFRLIGASVGR
jgi:hypothetical protein